MSSGELGIAPGGDLLVLVVGGKGWHHHAKLLGQGLLGPILAQAVKFVEKGLKVEGCWGGRKGLAASFFWAANVGSRSVSGSAETEQESILP